MQTPRRELQAGVGRRADVPAERVPGLVVVPGLELAPTVLDHVFRRPEVEPRIELVDDAPIVDDSEETYSNREEEAAHLQGCTTGARR